MLEFSWRGTMGLHGTSREPLTCCRVIHLVAEPGGWQFRPRNAPVTREPLKEHQLVPNLAIKEAVQAYLGLQAELLVVVGGVSQVLCCLLLMLINGHLRVEFCVSVTKIICPLFSVHHSVCVRMRLDRSIH